jgi:hypothetical protein
MLDLFNRHRKRESGRVSTVLCECRRCGMTLDSEREHCPHCEPAEVVCYEFE